MKRQLLLISCIVLISTSCSKRVVVEEPDMKAYKMEQIASLFESIARQPEAAETLIQATEMIYSSYTELLPISDQAVEERGRCRGVAFGAMFDAIARQPEAFTTLDAVAAKFLGAYNKEYISDELLEYTKAYCVSNLNESLARQPEAKDLFNQATVKYLNFSITD